MGAIKPNIVAARPESSPRLVMMDTWWNDIAVVISAGDEIANNNSQKVGVLNASLRVQSSAEWRTSVSFEVDWL